VGNAASNVAGTLDWLLAGAVLLALGTLLGIRLLAPAWPSGSARAWARAALALLCLLFAAALPLNALVLTEAAPAELPGATWLVLWQTHNGAMWLLGALGVVLAGAALAAPPASAARPASRARRWQSLVMAAGLLLFLLAKADTGHAAEHGLASLLVWVHALHIGAGCAWAGSVLVAWLQLRGRSRAAAWPDAFLRRLSQVAATCLAVVAVTGLVNLWRLLGNGSGGLGEYGQWLALKLALVVAAAGLGAWNRWVALPRVLGGSAAARRPLLVSLGLESVLLALTVLAAARLGGTMPPM